MQTIKFTAEIKDGIVHIPNKYRHLKQQKRAKFIVLYDDVVKTKTKIQQKDNIFDKFQIDFSRFKFDREYATQPNHRKST